ncbi:MAG: hypothetical protein WBB86_06530 [Candidatus Omnitrophota bacterium]
MSNRYLKLLVFLLIPALVFTQQGCVDSSAEKEKRILAYDPSFEDYLDKRNSLQAKLNDQKNAFLHEKLQIEGQISGLKEKNVQLKEEYIVSIGETKRQIQPERRRLRQDLLEMKRRYALKKTELRATVSDIKEISALIKRKDKLALTREEMQTWNKRLSSLLEKKAGVLSEMEKLDKEIEITRLKIKVLMVD